MNRKGQKKTHDALKIIGAQIGDDNALRALVDKRTLNAEIAELIYEERTKAGLTQAELAELIHTKQSVISRLENADYRGHSLHMLDRIAHALHRRVRVGFVDEVTA
jgi:ribosome-binding protein aMBF1 (putative translation factor)